MRSRCSGAASRGPRATADAQRIQHHDQRIADMPSAASQGGTRPRAAKGTAARL